MASFEKFRNKRYYKPERLKGVSLDAQNHNITLNCFNPAFKLLKPKKLSKEDPFYDKTKPVYDSPKVKALYKLLSLSKEKPFSNVNSKEEIPPFGPKPNEGLQKELYYKISLKKLPYKRTYYENDESKEIGDNKPNITNISKISTQDNSISIINRSNARIYKENRSNSDLTKNKKIIKASLNKDKAVQTEAFGNEKDLLLKKIATVFRQFKERQEVIEKSFEKGRKKGKIMVKCPRIIEL